MYSPGGGNQHAHGEKMKKAVLNLRAVGFHVEVVAPAADGLRKNQAGSEAVQKGKGTDFLPTGIKQYRCCTSNHPAVNGKAAFPDAQNGEKIIPEKIPAHENIVKTRPDNADGYGPEHYVQNAVLGKALALFLLLAKKNGNQHPGNNQHAVPRNAGKNRAAVRNRQGLSLLFVHYILPGMGCQEFPFGGRNFKMKNKFFEICLKSKNLLKFFAEIDIMSWLMEG